MSFGHLTTLTYLGHASFRLDMPSGDVVLLDPWLRGNPACPDHHARPSRVDAILVTHGHQPHFADVVALAREHDAMVVSARELGQWLIERAQLAPERVLDVNVGGRVEPVAGLEVTAVRAEHSSTVRNEDGSLAPGGAALGFVLRGDAMPTLYCAGDTAAFAEMMVIGEVLQPEVAILPVDGRYTMDAGGAAWAAQMLGVRHVVPCHDEGPGSEALAAKLTEMENAPSLARLSPGQSAE